VFKKLANNQTCFQNKNKDPKKEKSTTCIPLDLSLKFFQPFFLGIVSAPNKPTKKIGCMDRVRSYAKASCSLGRCLGTLHSASQFLALFSVSWLENLYYLSRSMH